MASVPKCSCHRIGTPVAPLEHIDGRYTPVLCCIFCCCYPDQSCWTFYPVWKIELNRQVFFGWLFAILATIIFTSALWFQFEAYTLLMLIFVIPAACLLGSLAACFSFFLCPIHVWTQNQIDV